MNYTQNYQLPQWVTTDRVLMADFNDAMAKTDAAIEKAAPFTLLRRAVITGDTADYALNLAGLPFESYQEIGIYLALSATNNTDVFLYFNDLIGSNYLNSLGNSADYLGYFFTAEGVPCKGHIRLLTNQWGAGITHFIYGRGLFNYVGSCSQINAASLSTLRFKAEDGLLKAGGIFWIFGVKGFA